MSQDPLRAIRRHVPRERATFPDPLYLQEWLEPARDDAERLLSEAVGEIFVAHAVMLGEQRIVDATVVSRLLTILTRCRSISDARPDQPLSRVHREAVVAESGALFTALAYEEITAAAARIVLRERLLALGDATLELRESIAELASGHLTTLMLATANGQVVQPTSLGHYMSGYLGPLGRSQARLQESFGRVNRSPLGAMSGMSTAMPIRRGRVADLLGFDAVIDSTVDAIAGTDVLLELVANLSIAAIDLGRLVMDLSYWARDDVGLMIPGDEFVHSGSAQPQRRDPLVLDVLRAATARLSGAVGEVTLLLNGQRGMGGDASRLRAIESVHSHLQSMERTHRLVAKVLRTSIVNRAMFANRTNRGFSTSSELADLLTVDFELPRAEAMALVESVVIEASEMGMDATTLTTQFVDRVALRLIGREIGIEAEMLARCLSPKRFIERRTATGAPAPRAVGAALERESFAARKDRGWIDEQRLALDAARRALHERAAESISDPGALLQRPIRRIEQDAVRSDGTIP